MHGVHCQEKKTFKRNWAFATNSNFLNHIFATGWCKPFIFLAKVIRSKRMHCLKYLMSTILSCKDIGIKNESWLQSLYFFLTTLFRHDKKNCAKLQTWWKGYVKFLKIPNILIAILNKLISWPNIFKFDQLCCLLSILPEILRIMFRF